MAEDTTQADILKAITEMKSFISSDSPIKSITGMLGGQALGIASMKGLTSAGTTLSRQLEKLEARALTMEPGDFVNKDMQQKTAIPLAQDLWYIWGHLNQLARYYSSDESFIGDTYDYTTYLSENMAFLDKLPGLKPLLTIRDWEQFVVHAGGEFVSPYVYRNEYTNNGVYWVNILFWELVGTKDSGVVNDSTGPAGMNRTDYCGYLTFPVGMLGVMEVISLMAETDLSGYAFSGGQSPSSAGYTAKPEVSLDYMERPQTDEPDMFPPVPKELNRCYGHHLIEKNYLVVDASLELLAKFGTIAGKTAPAVIPYWGVEIEPKKWMRYWIKKENTWPVPGEYIGILCKPTVTPPHMWWFQKSSPFLYAGNWMETKTLTTGIITDLILEEDRTDGVNDDVGDLYFIKIQGCEVAVLTSDFFRYAVGERVTLVKLDRVNTTYTGELAYKERWPAKADTMWTFKETTKKTEEGYTVMENYIIVPLTFYIGK